MGAGAAAGAVIAAHQRRKQEVVDAFRLGEATAPTRARRLEQLGLVETSEMRELMIDGVLIPGPDEGTYYLSEAAYLYRRDTRKGFRVFAVVAAVLVIAGLLLLMRVVPQ